jgi:UDP-perosamine 4-acetyltransferase
MMKSAEADRVCVILGGGGHARALLDLLRSSSVAVPFAILEADPTRWGQEVHGVPVPGGDDLLAALAAEGRVNCFAVGLGGVGNNTPRQRLFELGLAAGLAPLTLIHPRAICSAWSEIGAGAQLMPGCIVNADARIGRNVIVNCGAVVEHDGEIGDHAHIATGATLAGHVLVGTGSHVGVGASVRQGVRIGRNVIVGAGAAVVHDVPDDVVVVGVPARILREQRKDA